MNLITYGGHMTDRRRAGARVFWATLLVLAGSVVSVGAASTAPDFTLPDTKGHEVTLSKLLEDGPVVLDFWATWCKPCIKAFPELQEVQDEFGPCGLRVVTVSIDGPRSVSRVAPFVKSKGHTFDVVLDTAQRVAKKYHVTSVPRTVLVDTNGNVAYSVIGYRPGNHAKLVAEIRKLLPEECPEEDAGEEPAGDAVPEGKVEGE